jgi:hypothetical protein
MKSYWVGVAAVLVVLAVALTVALLHESARLPWSRPAVPSVAGQPPPGQAAPAPGQAPPVLAVKIDNVDEARPATGLAASDVVYVEPVEGGLTRLLAVYTSRRPSVVGPVRSARITDLRLLAQFGRPVLAYSGAAPPLLPRLSAGPIVNASAAQSPGAYFRNGDRASPHNLYLHPAGLPAAVPGSSWPAWSVGPPPSGGRPSTEQRASYPAASFDFRWSPASRGWLVWMDGTPFRDTASGQLSAATVVLQQVGSQPEPFPEDSLGGTAPIAETVGSGRALVLRDGESFQASWSRPTPSSATVYTTEDGHALPFAPGQTWILLLPEPGAPVS